MGDVAQDGPSTVDNALDECVMALKPPSKLGRNIAPSSFPSIPP
jgi:hypothetical protein